MFNQKVRLRRAAFTLVELLIVMAIFGIMATLVLGVIRNAQQDARASATISRINLIESILATEMEEYDVRRLPVSLSDLLSQAPQTNPMVHVREERRRLIQELINVELPRLGVSTATPIGGKYPNYDGSARAARIAGNIGGNVNTHGEYLYLILQEIEVDGRNALDMLSSASIGDPDGDGAPDIVDAWGDGMELRIYQVSDQSDNDFDSIPEGQTLPEGYVLLDPQTPRRVDEIRFEILSEKLGRNHRN